MAGTSAAGDLMAAPRRHKRFWGRGLQGSDLTWALAFLVPYAAVFVLFVIYPVGYGLWLGHRPALYAELFADPIYLRTLVNTVVFLAIGVNLHLFLALLLSGYFMQKSRWVKALLLVFILPWAAPAIPTFISIHWMLNGQWGLINNILWHAFGVDNGPPWLTERWLTFGTVIVAYIWKWTPFWTVILMAGRTAIPQEAVEAAAVDGAVGIKCFIHVTFPLLANLYLVCTLLSTIWTLGDFNTVYFVSGGGPALSTNVLATLGIRNAFQVANPELGMATVMSALPLLIPLVIVLMRKLSKSQVQL
ncbi:MAG: carbohydrate ABC transporter permease [Acetobacteraceae bacterium]